MRSEKVAKITTSRKQFFFKWVEYTKPFHGLRKQLQDALALLLYHHYELGKVISNNKILWKQVFDYDTKILIMEDLNIPQTALENIYTQLRKAGVVKDNQIVPVFIPNITKDTTEFTIKINFSFDDNKG